jgi:hypothetical protein
MADCSNLDQQIKQVEAELAAVQKLKRANAAGAAQRAKKPPNTETFRTFSMVDGTKLRLNPMEFWDEVERLNVGRGEEAIRELVQANFDSKVKPRGSEALNINYAEMPFNEENVNILLELMGERRRNSPTGRDLMTPFTKEVAGQQMMAEIGLRGGNVEEIARGMSKKYKAIDRLPMNMVMSKMMRQDSTRHLADMLDDYAELLGTVGITPQLKENVARAAQYANFFEQVDALMSRRVGQALNARRFSLDTFEQYLQKDMLSYGDVYKLNADTLQDGSLAAQIFDAIKTDDASALKRIARTRRLSALSDVPINDPNFFTSVQLLNAYRKGNMFSGPATLIQRNVVSGALVNASYMMEDVYSGAFRLGMGGLVDAWKAGQYAKGQTYAGMSQAWDAAMDMLTEGRSTFTREGSIEDVTGPSMRTRKEDAIAAMNEAWDSVFSNENYVGKPVDIMRLFNTGARYTVGMIAEKLTDGASTAGYSPVFSLMQAGDEVTRQMAFTWKVGHESYLRAVEEWNQFDVNPPGVKKSNWIRNRANELVEGATFSGLMKDDELVALRRKVGGAQYGDMSTEELRLKMFNDLKGVPNASDELGRMGLDRGMDVTFTQPLTDNITGAVQRARQNPLVGWVMPVWQTTANSLKWLLERDLMVATVKQVALEQKYGILGGKKAAKRMAEAENFSPEQLAQARGKTLNAFFIALTTNALWQAGLFTDGGSFNPENNKIEPGQIPPYSFSIGLTGSLQASKLALPGRTIDLVDLMGLQADIHRAHTEGFINEFDASRLMEGVVVAYARVLNDKNTLKGVTNLLNGMTSFATGQSVDWADTTASTMTGIMPYSGVILSAFRGFSDPNKARGDRREFTPEEEQLFGENPDVGLFQTFRDILSRNLPLPGEMRVERDWLGRERKRPIGLPIDLTAPFAPVLVSDTPLDRWLTKHKLGDMPNGDQRLGSAELGSGYGATMTNDEYNAYRKGMYSAVGSTPAEMVLGDSNTFINTGLAQYNINQYVQGNTLLEALQKLSVDPDYNADLNTPNSPSLAAQLGRPSEERALAKRKYSTQNPTSDPRQVLRVYNAIVNYYSWAGAQSMMQQHPEFAQRAVQASGDAVRGGAIIEDLEATPLGLSPQ